MKEKETDRQKDKKEDRQTEADIQKDWKTDRQTDGLQKIERQTVYFGVNRHTRSAFIHLNVIQR